MNQKKKAINEMLSMIPVQELPKMPRFPWRPMPERAIAPNVMLKRGLMIAKRMSKV